MRIDVMEALEILGYAIGPEAENAAKLHFRKYNDWNRIKDIVIKELIRRNHEHIRLQKTLAKLIAQMETEKQTHLF